METRTQANIEKRKDFRVPIDMTVRVKQMGRSGNALSVRGLDLSESGIRLVSKEMLDLAKDLVAMQNLM